MDEPRPDDIPPEQPEQPAKQPEQSEQSPVDISADVDALLAEASALAGQIAEDTGAAVNADGSPALGQADAMAADPKEAVDDVEAKLAALESLVNEAVADDGPPGDAHADKTSAGETGSDDSGFDANANAEGASDALPDRAGAANRGNATAASTKATPKGGKSANEFADEDFEKAFDESLVGDVEVSLDDCIVDAPEDFGLDASESKTAALRKPLARLSDLPKQVFAAFKKFFARGFFKRLGDTIIFRAIWAGLELIDGPFAGLSPNAKRNIGIIGIITLVCGILSLVLPGMFESNPYLDMVANP